MILLSVFSENHEQLNFNVMIRHCNLIVTGTVQRCGFRFLTLKRACELGIKGFVKYLEEKNAVYIEAEGEEEAMESFLKFIKKGPPFSEVKSVDIQEAEVKNFSTFEIIKSNNKPVLQHA